MTWYEEAGLAGRLLLATVLGGIIGLERKQEGGKHHSAGIRTYAAVSVGACLFGIISIYAPGAGNADRIAAQIVSGIGFLGAGVIMVDRGQVKGLTTAATLWSTAAIGLGIANTLYILSILSTAIVYGLLLCHRVPGWKEWTSPKKCGEDEESKDLSTETSVEESP